MPKEMYRIEVIRREASDLKLLLYQALRKDIMAYTAPCSLILEKVTLVMPEVITAIERAIRTLLKTLTYLSSEGISAKKHADIFPTLNKETLLVLVINPNAPVPQEVELRSTNTDRGEIVTFVGSTIRGRGIDQDLEEILPPLKEIVVRLVECLKERFDNFITDPFFTAIALLLDTASYKHKTSTEIYNAVMILVERFDDLLMANGFKLECLGTLKQEIFAASNFCGFGVEV